MITWFIDQPIRKLVSNYFNNQWFKAKIRLIIRFSAFFFSISVNFGHFWHFTDFILKIMFRIIDNETSLQHAELHLPVKVRNYCSKVSWQDSTGHVCLLGRIQTTDPQMNQYICGLINNYKYQRSVWAHSETVCPAENADRFYLHTLTDLIQGSWSN